MEEILILSTFPVRHMLVCPFAMGTVAWFLVWVVRTLRIRSVCGRNGKMESSYMWYGVGYLLDYQSPPCECGDAQKSVKRT